MLGQAHLGQRDAGRFDEIDKLRRILLDSLVQIDRGPGRHRVGHGTTEVAHQGIEPTVEALANGHESPAAIASINFPQHDCALAREIGACKVETGEFLRLRDQAQVASCNLGQRSGPIEAGGNDDPFDVAC